MSQHHRLVDSVRAISLDGGFTAAVVVAADGSESLWVLKDETRHRFVVDGIGYGNARPTHERTGRLPAHIRDRLWGDSLRCGRRRWDGQACRHRVAEPGGTCSAHRSAPPP